MNKEWRSFTSLTEKSPLISRPKDSWLELREKINTLTLDETALVIAYVDNVIKTRLTKTGNGK